MARTRPASRSRGAVVAEAAFVIPGLFLLLFGIIEIGGLLKSYSGSANAVRAGGRMASVMGNEALADQEIMQRVGEEASGISSGEIEFIIIWHASGRGDTVPAACIAAAGAALVPNNSSLGVADGGSATNAVGACNVYVRPQANNGAFEMASGRATQVPAYYFGCSGPSDPAASHKLDCNWPGSHRRTVISPRVLPVGTPEANRLTPDYIGIYIRAEHQYYTGFIGNSIQITDASINLLEPSHFGVGS